MSYSKCATCGRYGWATHVCPPVWEFQIDGEDVGFRRGVRAVDGEEAAQLAVEHWVRQSDGDPPLVDAILCLVRREGATETLRFWVSAEIEIRYRARSAS